jgi:integrase
MIVKTEEIDESTKDIKSEVLHSDLSLQPWITNPYLAAATSSNTRKAYRSDIKHFEKWGGILPATPDKIVQYLQAFANVLNTRTLARRLIAIKHWHDYQGFPNPVLHPVVIKTMTGITRVHGKPKEKAKALSPEDLQKMVAILRMDSSLIASRDNAILQIGYFGALRRSEIINIRYEHINWLKEGIEILLTKSKTDQAHEGQYCAIPYGNQILCPIKALENWLTKSNIKEGAIFRRIVKNQILSDTPLTALSINHIIHRCATLAKLSHVNHISPHSLRRGLATSAAQANAPIQTIMRAGRWKQVNTVMEYIEASARFNDSAATSVLLNMENDDKNSF